jgi:hypothetical protein
MAVSIAQSLLISAMGAGTDNPDGFNHADVVLRRKFDGDAQPRSVHRTGPRTQDVLTITTRLIAPLCAGRTFFFDTRTWHLRSPAGCGRAPATLG